MSWNNNDYFLIKSGNFGQRVNSAIHLQTVEIQIRRLLMSRLIIVGGASVVVSLFIVAPIVCGCSVFYPCFAIQYNVSSKVMQSS